MKEYSCNHYCMNREVIKNGTELFCMGMCEVVDICYKKDNVTPTHGKICSQCGKEDGANKNCPSCRVAKQLGYA